MPHLDSFLPLILIQLVLLQNPGVSRKEDGPIRIQVTKSGIKLNFSFSFLFFFKKKKTLPLRKQLLLGEVSRDVIIFFVISMFDLNGIRGQEHRSLGWTVYVIVQDALLYLRSEGSRQGGLCKQKLYMVVD